MKNAMVLGKKEKQDWYMESMITLNNLIIRTNNFYSSPLQISRVQQISPKVKKETP